AEVRRSGRGERVDFAHSRLWFLDVSQTSGETILCPWAESRWPGLASLNLRVVDGYVKSCSMSAVDVSSTLSEELERLGGESKARAIAVALHDLETGFRFSLRGDRWFHAASTIKVAVLLAIFRAADEGRLRLDHSLHVRNRFFSAADGFPFHLNRDSDAMPELYESIGRTAKISALAEGMITASSNLATNLLLDF